MGASAAFTQDDLEIPKESRLQQMFRQLKHGIVLADEEFDRIYPEWVRERSHMHWTPVSVVRRAVELLTEKNSQARILDVGSGVGKFCLIGATVSQARFVGIEQRSHLLQISRRLMHHYRIPRLTFSHAGLGGVDWSGFDGIYLFNPFQEHKVPFQRIDSTIELSRDIFSLYVEETVERLKSLARGARVVTYHGFGGVFPEGFELIIQEFCHRGPLECWEKTF